MPWNKSDYPVSMKNLPAQIRNKAIEIANALIEEKNMDEGIAIATAISRAKDWGANRGKKTENTEKSRVTDQKKHGEDRYVVPHGKNEWASSHGTLTIQSKQGKVQKRISYNPRKKAPKMA